MSLDLAFDDAQAAIVEALERFSTAHSEAAAARALAGEFPGDAWRELAQLGVLAAGSPDGEGGVLEVVAVMEALGRAVFPGPLVATFVATQLLEAGERRAVADGELIACAGVPPLLGWAQHAGLFLEIAGEHIFRAHRRGAPTAVATLGGEPWARVELERQVELPGAQRALLVGDIAYAAYLASAGARLVEDAARHASARVQFGRAIGEFQAVAHPLADAHMRVEAAISLARSAAYQCDAGSLESAASRAAAARLSARAAALDAVHVAHQTFGAIGITLEGPAFHISRRIRQLASDPSGEERSRASLLAHFEVAP